MTATIALFAPEEAAYARLAAAVRALDFAPRRLNEAAQIQELLGARGTALLLVAPAEALDVEVLSAWRRRVLDPDRPGLVLRACAGPWSDSTRRHLRDLDGAWPDDVAPQELQEALRAALTRVRATRERAAAWPDPAWALPGPSSAMQAARRALELASRRPDATVWVEGPPGGGRRAIARAVHALSPRAPGPFRVFEPTGDGVLDGRRLERAFEDTLEGTLCVDSIERLAEPSPARLATWLERAADRRPRLVVAAGAQSDRLVEAGRLDAGLARRLNVLRIAIPPLDERPEDAEATAQAALAQAVQQRFGRDQVGRLKLGEGAGAWLMAHVPGEPDAWRRLLEGALWKLDELPPGAEIGPGELEEAHRAPEPGATGGEQGESLDGLRRRRIEEVLAASGGNKSEAARRLGIHRATLHAQLKRYGLG